MDTQKAVELIEKSEHIALLLPLDAGIDCWVAAEVLADTLEEKTKTVGFLIPPAADKMPPASFKKVMAAAPLMREFIVSLDTSRSPVSQLRYEKNEGRIDIVLSPQSSPVQQESFSFRQGNVQCDCVIALGIPDIETWGNHPGLDPHLLLGTPIINIDTAQNNRRYGEINLVAPDRAALCEIISELLQAASIVPKSENAIFLLAGIMAGNNFFDSPRVSASTLHTAAGLINAGASYPAARELARIEKPLALLQLASRAAVRSKENGDTILWSFLTTEDFEKTGRLPNDIPFVLRHLDAHFSPHNAHVLLWQDPEEKDVRAILRADAPVLETVANREPGAFQSPHFGLHARFATFQEAEERIASLLKEAR